MAIQIKSLKILCFLRIHTNSTYRNLFYAITIMDVSKDLITMMFIALFIKIKNWKQSKCPIKNWLNYPYDGKSVLPLKIML